MLRTGVKFHNGRELTSEDVKYSIERIRDPNKASQGKALMDGIDTVDTSDKYVAKVMLKERVPDCWRRSPRPGAPSWRRKRSRRPAAPSTRPTQAAAPT